jgi:hypothetical protein
MQLKSSTRCWEIVICRQLAVCSCPPSRDAALSELRANLTLPYRLGKGLPTNHQDIWDLFSFRRWAGAGFPNVTSFVRVGLRAGEDP